MIRNASLFVLPHLLLIGVAVLPSGAAVALALIWAASQVAVVTELLRPRSLLFGENFWHAGPQPRVALTFDDGPHPEDTPAILDILKRAGTSATFFFVGEKARAHPDLVRRVASEGHEVEVHSDTHPWWFSVAWRGRIRREVHQANQTVKHLSGVTPRYFRPPMGHKNIFLAEELRQAGLTQACWSTRAYDTCRRRPERIRDVLLSRVTCGGIILLHESVARTAGKTSATVAALPGLIDGLKQGGLTPVTLERLLQGPQPPAPSPGPGQGRA